MNDLMSGGLHRLWKDWCVSLLSCKLCLGSNIILCFNLYVRISKLYYQATLQFFLDSGLGFHAFCFMRLMWVSQNFVSCRLVSKLAPFPSVQHLDMAGVHFFSSWTLHSSVPELSKSFCVITMPSLLKNSFVFFEPNWRVLLIACYVSVIPPSISAWKEEYFDD